MDVRAPKVVFLARGEARKFADLRCDRRTSASPMCVAARGAWLAAAGPAAAEPTKAVRPPASGTQSTGPEGPQESPAETNRGWRPQAGPNLLHYDNLVAVRMNPIGVVNLFRLGYRRVLWTRPGQLFEGTYADIKAQAFLNPAYARVGPLVEVMPLAIVRLSARYTYAGYWNAFGLLQSFPSATADASPSDLRDNADAGETYATGGHVVTLQGLVQARFLGVALRDEVTAQWSKLDLRDGDVVFHEQFFDLLVPNAGWVFVNDLDLFYTFDFGLVVGARYTVTHAVYENRHFAPAEVPSNPNTPHHRVGPAVLYTFFRRPGARFDNLTFILLAQWWARHRYRTGQDVHAAYPYLVLGLGFDGQLWPTRPPYPHRRLRSPRKVSKPAP